MYSSVLTLLHCGNKQSPDLCIGIKSRSYLGYALYLLGVGREPVVKLAMGTLKAPTLGMAYRTSAHMAQAKANDSDRIDVRSGNFSPRN